MESTIFMIMATVGFFLDALPGRDMYDSLSEHYGKSFVKCMKIAFICELLAFIAACFIFLGKCFGLIPWW